TSPSDTTSVLAMIGECTGNVRSTPTPKLTLRTVNVSRTPVPCRRMTAPWNTWTRSRVPSTTRTWTFTESPGRNSGMSSRRLSRSMMSVGFMGRVSPRIAVRHCPPGPWTAPHVRSRPGHSGETGLDRPRRGSPMVAVFDEEVHLIVFNQELDLVRRKSTTGCYQIGAAGQGSGQGICQPPSTNPSVVARPEHSGNLPVSKFGRPGVVRILEETIGEALLPRRFVVAQDTRQETGNGLHHDQGRQFASGQDKVPNRDLVVDQMVGDPLVHTLIATAQHREALRRPG